MPWCFWVSNRQRMSYILSCDLSNTDKRYWKININWSERCLMLPEAPRLLRGTSLQWWRCLPVSRTWWGRTRVLWEDRGQVRSVSAISCRELTIIARAPHSPSTAHSKESYNSQGQFSNSLNPVCWDVVLLMIMQWRWKSMLGDDIFTK